MTSYADRDRDFAFMGWIKTRPCLLRDVEGAGACAGVVEAAHAGGIGTRAKSHKSDDRETIPLCGCHHRQFDSTSGYFAGWDRPRMRDWANAQIAALHELWEALRPLREGRGVIPF